MNVPRRRFLHLAAAFSVAPATSHVAQAQIYPSRTIRLIVPFPAGGAFDVVGRPWADRMKSRLGTIIVENMGGGGGSVGAATVAHARPDGYTLLMGGTLTHVTEALLKRHPLYDPFNDLTPIADVAVYYLGIAIHPSLPIRTLKELIEFAKVTPNKLSYAHVGIGSLNHLTGELLKSMCGVTDLQPVPYRGGTPAVADIVSGQVPIGVLAATGQLLEFHWSGRLRILAVTSPKRLIAEPTIPTVEEDGLGGLTAKNSIGLFAPSGTPGAIVDQIAQASRTVLSDPMFQQLLVEAGYELDLDTDPDKYRRSLEEDTAHWAPVVTALGLKID